MRYGFVAPGFDIRTLGELAREVEESGWDGLFIADAVYGIDPWVALAVVAVSHGAHPLWDDADASLAPPSLETGE